MEEKRKDPRVRKQYEILVKELEAIGLVPSEKQAEQLLSYYDMVLKKNQVMNLTTITEYGEFVKKHYVDSLILCGNTDLTGEKKLVDIGTGAGFPGIPLKILFPELQILLVDSLNKRVRFLCEVIAELDLIGIEAIHSRAEEPTGKKEYREQYDLCVSRAVANLTTLAEYCLPYVAVGGEFVAYKSGQVQEEIEEAAYAIRLLGGEVGETEYFCLPGTDIERTLIHIKKIGLTPKNFPRNAGMPARTPLRRKDE